MNFGEKPMEYSQRHGKDLPVWQSPKFIESRKKAAEIIESQKYGVQESDFWILMNATKNEKMAYTGLIISHNGCLKINDCLESKFDPSCVTIDKEGYKGSLVYTYCNKEQGIYEVGEVSTANCKNEYPYAMAYKRLFDRVVLKLSKLAYAGIYSDSEADEFTQRLDSDGGKKAPEPIVCKRCLNPIQVKKNGGKIYTPEEIALIATETYGQKLCWTCMGEVKRERAGDPNATGF